MTNTAKLFKPDDIVIKLGEKEHRLVYDLNSFVELEKIYASVDELLQMLLGGTQEVVEPDVKYNGVDALAADITVDGVPLDVMLAQQAAESAGKQAKHSDTLNLLWAGLLHDNSVYNDDGDIVRYNISKAQIGAQVTFRNLRELNAQVVIALLRDLIPPQEADDANVETKNEEAPVQKPLTLAPKAE